MQNKPQPLGQYVCMYDVEGEPPPHGHDKYLCNTTFVVNIGLGFAYLMSYQSSETLSFLLRTYLGPFLKHKSSFGFTALLVEILCMYLYITHRFTKHYRKKASRECLPTPAVLNLFQWEGNGKNGASRLSITYPSYTTLVVL
jgi:hypothetical protein